MVCIVFAKLEKAKITGIFSIQDNEVLVTVLMEFFWPAFVIIALLTLPGIYVEHIFKRH